MENQNNNLSKITKKLISSIKSGRFNYENYLKEKPYFSFSLMTQPVFTSYGRIGYDIYIYDEKGSHVSTINYDEEMDKLTINDEPLDRYLDSERENEFLQKLKNLLKEYNAEIDTVEVRLNGNKIKDWSYADDEDESPVVYTEDDIRVLAADTL